MEDEVLRISAPPHLEALTAFSGFAEWVTSEQSGGRGNTMPGNGNSL